MKAKEFEQIESSRITDEEMDLALKLAGSQRSLARAIGTYDRTVSRWVNGELPIGVYAKVIRAYTKMLQSTPKGRKQTSRAAAIEYLDANPSATEEDLKNYLESKGL